MPSKYRRLSVVLSPELEKKLYDLRKTDEYCRMSISEIFRTYFEKGLEAEKHKTA